jgi:DNA-binding transcriptional regulator YiaG
MERFVGKPPKEGGDPEPGDQERGDQERGDQERGDQERGDPERGDPEPEHIPVPPEYKREIERERDEIVTLATFGATYPGFVPQAISVQALRGRLKMTRAQFARRFGFPVETVRHWERGDRKPRTAALVLLNLIDRNSMVALRLLRKRVG